VKRTREAHAPGYFNRLIERKVAELGGIKSLYSDSFFTPEEFQRYYGGGPIAGSRRNTIRRVRSRRCTRSACCATERRHLHRGDRDRRRAHLLLLFEPGLPYRVAPSSAPLGSREFVNYLSAIVNARLLPLTSSRC